MNAAIEIGASKDAVKAAQKAVMEILNVRADQKTIRVALKTYQKVLRVSNVTIQNRVFSGCNCAASVERDDEWPSRGQKS